MADFAPAAALILKHEGQTYVNDPVDPGGATRFGCTLAVVQAYRSQKAGRPMVVTAADIAALTWAEAQQIYRANYWNAVRGDAIASQTVANFFCDMAVLRGVPSAVKAMQAVLGVMQDGAFGPMSLAALNKADPKALLLGFYALCEARFIELVVETPAKLKFLQNWSKRAGEMVQAVASGQMV